jgi:hypothetical protein
MPESITPQVKTTLNCETRRTSGSKYLKFGYLVPFGKLPITPLRKFSTDLR